MSQASPQSQANQMLGHSSVNSETNGLSNMVFTKELTLSGWRTRKYLDRRPRPVQGSDQILLGSGFWVLTCTPQLKQWSQQGTGNKASWMAQLMKQEEHAKDHALIPSHWSEVTPLLSLFKILHNDEDELSNLC